MHFPRRQKTQPIVPAVAVWPGAMGRDHCLRRYIPPHYGRPDENFEGSTVLVLVSYLKQIILDFFFFAEIRWIKQVTYFPIVAGYQVCFVAAYQIQLAGVLLSDCI
ncbi:hypothetical protein Hanom_Chr15g01376331 [Helianthus anomalus]